MGVDDWVTLAEGLVLKGVTRFRVTGGEPLLHPHVVEIVARIARVPGVEDVALTTNATQLEELAEPLARAGLHRLNVSIDSLDEARFAALSRGGSLRSVLAGIDAARAAGFTDIKTNTVVIADRDDDDLGNLDELAAIVEWAWARELTPRFLEVMTIGEGARFRDRIVPYPAMLARVEGLVEEGAPARPNNRGPARYLRARDRRASGDGRRVGFITGSSDTFCEGCDRLRATSDGALRSCLAVPAEVDAREAIHAGNQGEIGAALDRAWAQKPDGTVWKGCTEESAQDVNMRATGG